MNDLHKKNYNMDKLPPYKELYVYLGVFNKYCKFAGYGDPSAGRVGQSYPSSQKQILIPTHMTDSNLFE